jgi:formate hydrogenlyase transcriptional activator
MHPLSAPRLQVDLQRYAALLEMADAVSRHHQAGDLFRELTPRLRAVSSFDFINFALYDSLHELMKLHVWDGAKWLSVPLEVTVEEAAAGWVWQRQTALSIPDIATERRFEPGLRWLREQGLRSYCVLPLTTGGKRLGSLGFGSRRPDAFAADDVQFLHRVAEIVALFVNNTLSQAALTEERDRVHALLEVETALAASLDLKELFAAAGKSIRRLVPHDLASISYFDESVAALREYTLDTPLANSSEGTLLSPDDSLIGQVFRRQQIQIFNHQELLKLALPCVQRALERGIKSSCLVPLATFRGPLGVLWLQSKADLAFPLECISLLKQVAGLVALSLENSLVHRSLRQQRERVKVLLGVSSTLASDWNVQQVFPEISAHLRRLLRQEYASLSLHDEKSGKLLRQVADFPLSKGFLSEHDVSVDAAQSPGGKALTARAPMIFGPDELQAFSTDFTSKLLAEGIKSVCCVPLGTPRGSLGILNLGSTRENAFKSDDLGLLRQVAGQLAVALENAGSARQIHELKNRLAEEKKYLEGEIRTEMNFEEIVGESPVLKQVLQQVATVASSDATVLVLGETGTGKELIARALHRMSGRKDRGFIKVNCAAIPTGLLESELFGHEKGAFTGAVSQKIGRMELADHGTLFLDEVGEIPLELQPKLLRVLQDHEFERLGGTRTIKVNLRLIAATNRDLAKSVSDGQFRSDLFYRLNVFPVRMPPLRDRREDIPMLVHYFVQKYARRMDRKIETIPKETMNALINWHWPGNVRELENFMERSVILSEGPALRVPLTELLAADRTAAGDHTLENAERAHIIRVLRQTGGVISGPTGAARRLGVKRTTLQSKIQRLKISSEDYSTRNNPEG